MRKIKNPVVAIHFFLGSYSQQQKKKGKVGIQKDEYTMCISSQPAVRATTKPYTREKTPFIRGMRTFHEVWSFLASSFRQVGRGLLHSAATREACGAVHGKCATRAIRVLTNFICERELNSLGDSRATNVEIDMSKFVAVHVLFNSRISG